MTFRIFGFSITINIILSLFITILLIIIFLNYENSKTKTEEFIRVDHAGERGAVKIMKVNFWL